MAKRGRIPKITKALIDRYCSAIANGMSRNRAADLIGVHRMTISRWLRQGRNGVGGPLYAHFVAEIARSEALFIEKNLKTVQRAAAPRRVRTTKVYTRADGSTTSEVTEKVEYDWQAAWKFLQTKDRDEFGADRYEIDALKADIKELRKLLAESLGKLSRPAEDQAGGAVQPSDRAGAVGGGSGNPAAAPPAGEPPSQPVDSESADGRPTGGAG